MRRRQEIEVAKETDENVFLCVRACVRRQAAFHETITTIAVHVRPSAPFGNFNLGNTDL